MIKIIVSTILYLYLSLWIHNITKKEIFRVYQYNHLYLLHFPNNLPRINQKMILLHQFCESISVTLDGYIMRWWRLNCIFLILHVKYYFLCWFHYLSFNFCFFYFFNFKGDVVGGRLSASNRYRGSRESLQSGMTYSARKGSSSTLHNGTYFSIFYFHLKFIFICFLICFVLYMIWTSVYC